MHSHFERPLMVFEGSFVGRIVDRVYRAPAGHHRSRRGRGKVSVGETNVAIALVIPGLGIGTRATIRLAGHYLVV